MKSSHEPYKGSQVQSSTFKVRDKDKIEVPQSSQKMLVLPHNCKIPCSRPARHHSRSGEVGRFVGDVEAVGFPVQNVYKMTYGDENTTFEPLNL